MSGCCRRALLLALLVVGGATTSDAASVILGGRTVRFEPPPGWVTPPGGPAAALTLYRPPDVGYFPHLIVTEGEAGTVAETLENLRKALPRFFREQGIEEPRLLLAPRAVPGPDRVEVAYGGRLGDVTCDWFQVVLPAKTSGLVFTFALPRGALEHWRSSIDAFSRSLRLDD